MKARGESADVGSLLAEARDTLARQRAMIERLQAGRGEPVAVLGLGVRLPAGIEKPDDLWSFLRAGGDAVGIIPSDRLDLDAYRDATPVREAALVAGHDEFDPGYFGISPREATGMDPQQRMILEVTDRALAEAGVAVRYRAAERIGAFVSTASDDYLLQSADLRRRELFDAYTGTGTARAVAAGRLGHVFGFTGPVLHVDTACSSALVAVHLACRSLRDGECELAVVAAANLIAAPQNLLLRSALSAVAPGGRSRPFAEDAEGFGQGEGALAVVLQPLAAALEAGRRPLAVIAGSAVNHNGRGAGLTVPRGEAQAEVIQAALRDAGVDPDDVDLVEAHGTGTRLGDPIEVAGLAGVYGLAGPVQLGSVKSNFGHLEAAAGLLSLAKVMLCLDNDTVAPSLHARVRTPEVQWERLRFELTTQPRDWPRRPAGRQAAISSFGMAGTNAHLIVTDPPPTPMPAPATRCARALLVSARSAWALRELGGAYADLLDELDHGEPAALADLRASAAVHRDHHRFRLVVVAGAAPAARDALRSWQRGEPAGELAGTDADAPPSITVVRADTPAAEVAAPLAELLPAGGYTVTAGPPPTRDPVLTVGPAGVRTGEDRIDDVLAAVEDPLERLAVALHLLGAQVDWARVHPPRSFTPVRLPHHPFRRTRLSITRPADWYERQSATGPLEERTDMADTVDTRSAEPAAVATAAVAGEIAGWMAELLGMAVGEIEPRRPLLELGADSLVFVELVSRVDATFGVELVLRQLFEELLTVDALAEYVIAHGGAPAAPQAEVTASTVDGPATYLSGLTETYTRMTARSITEYRAQLPVMCNNRRSASAVRPQTAAFAAPLRVVSSRAAHITDVDGNDYVDIAMGFGVNLFGHQASFIVEAVREQLAIGMQLGPESVVAGEVATLLAELTGQQRVLFCNSGTEAVMTMIRLARAYTGRRTIAVFRNSYHGHFDSTLVNPAGVHDVRAVATAIGIPPGLVEDVIVLPYGDRRALAEIRTRSASLAAVLVEPVQNRRPDLHPGAFLRELREITAADAVLLAFDEVLTGFRIHPGGAAAHFGVRPDIVSYAKVIGGGMPLGVVAGGAEVMDRVDGGASNAAGGGPELTYTAGTYCRHPLAMAAARAVLRVLHADGERLCGQLNRRTDTMCAELNGRFRDLGVPFATHNFGSFFRFSVNGNLSFAYQPLEMDYFNAAMLTKGVYIAEGGTCFLSTAHTDTDVERVVEAAAGAARELRDAGLLTLSTVDAGAAGAGVRPGPAVAGEPRVSTAPVDPLECAERPGEVPASSRAGDPAPLLSLSFFGDYPREAGTDTYDVLRAAAGVADGHLHALWVPERHFHSFGGLSANPSVLGAFLAGITTTIRIHAGSVVLPLHDPVRVAEEWAMVDALSGGRVAVAFASGWQRNDFVLAREPFEQRRAVLWREVETVRRLWRGEAVTLTRNGISTDVRLHPLPCQAELPVWIAALGSPETFRAAGTAGLSVLTNLVGQTSEQLAANIASYRDARRVAGIPGPGHVTALVHTLVTPDGAAPERARGPLHRYLGSSVDLLSAVTGSAQRLAFQRLHDGDRAYLLDRAVDRYLEHNAMVGDLDSALGVARRIGGYGVDEIACFVDFGVAREDLLTGVRTLLRLRERLTAGPDRAAPDRALVSPPAGHSRAADDVAVPPDGELEAVVASSPNEQLMWLACEADQDTALAHQVRTSLDVPARLDVDALQDAVGVVSARHQALRATVGLDGETLLVHRELAPVVHVVDLSALSDADRDEELAAWYEADASEPIDLAAGPPWRVGVLRLGERHSRLTVTAHHIVYDGTSERILLDELAAAYDGARDLPAPTDFLAWRREHRGPPPEADRRFWQQKLAGANGATGDIPTGELATGKPATGDLATGDLATGPGRRLRGTLDAGTVAALRRVAADAGCTPYVALLTCYVVHRIRSAGGGAVTVGVSADPRDGAARRGLIGYLSNLLPLRVELAEGTSVAAALPVVRRALLDAHEHQRLPFADILAGPSSPIVPTCFNWDHVTTRRLGGEPARVVPDPASFVRFRLSLNVVQTDDDPELTLEWDYNTTAHTAAEVAAQSEEFAGVVAELVGPPPRQETVHGRFRAVAARTPDTMAAYDRDTCVTFGELDERSDRVAAGLVAAGLPAESVLTIVGPLAVPTVVAMLGVLKAGAAYTVAPPSTPETVLAELVAATGSRMVLRAAGPATGPDQVQLAMLDASEPAVLPEVGPSDAAYVITTSGSSGRPKPVVVEHGNLLSYLDALAERVDLAGLGCLVVGSPAYDLCYTTLWSALTRGGTALLADEDAAADPRALAELGTRHPIDVAKMAPTHLDALLDTGLDTFLPRAHLLLGGEALRWATVHRVHRSRPDLSVWNHYGPTETTVGATMYRIGRPDPWQDRPTVPIGSAILGQVRVEHGELVVAGPGVSRGYLGLAQETAAAFGTRTEPDGTRVRWYRTGDLVSELPDGNLEFLGRHDNQVSLRGHRVELDALDGALCAVPGVAAAASCVLGDGTDVRLAAGLVLTGDLTPARVRTVLAGAVATHLVPSTLVALERLPRTESGKLDRRALATALGAATSAGPGPAARTNGNGAAPDLDDRLARMTEIWRAVLETDAVHPDADFFDLGGHSIHAIKIVARIRKVFDRRVAIRVLFDHASPRALLAQITPSPTAVQLQ